MPNHSQASLPHTAKSTSHQSLLRELGVQRIAVGFCLGRRVEQEWLFLALRNKFRQEWGLPKGHTEPGEALLMTARRECAEECGIGLLSVLGDPVILRYPIRTRSGNKRQKATIYYPAVTNIIDTLLSDEHDQARWCTLNELCSLLPQITLQNAAQQLAAVINQKTR